eukprot:4456635-Alexandrium_andersonii.AAC.1
MDGAGGELDVEFAELTAQDDHHAGNACIRAHERRVAAHISKSSKRGRSATSSASDMPRARSPSPSSCGASDHVDAVPNT